MSKPTTRNTQEECITWSAPHLNVDEDNRFSQQTAMSPAMHARKLNTQNKEKEYRSGFDQGYKDGVEKGQEEIREQVMHLQSLMTTLAMPLLDLDKQVIDELVELSMAVVKQLVRRELKTSPDEIVSVVKEALNLLPVTAGDVRLELHIEDAAIVRNAFGTPESGYPWKIIENPALTRGDCRVLTNTSRIDATVENRINAAIASILGNERGVIQE